MVSPLMRIVVGGDKEEQKMFEKKIFFRFNYFHPAHLNSFVNLAMLKLDKARRYGGDVALLVWEGDSSGALKDIFEYF